MRKNILKISFSRLKKQEIKQLASRVINIVEGYNPETLEIKEIYDFLVELKPQIESLKLDYISHPISEELYALRKQRIALANGIIDQMKLMEFGKITGMGDAIKVAKPIVLQHLHGLWSCDQTAAYQNVHTFLSLFADDEKLQTAFDTLGLNSYLNNLKIVNNTIEEQDNNRTQDLSERPIAVTPKIVAQINTALQDLFKQIEVAQVKNRMIDYNPLIARLNKEIAILIAKLKTRSTNSKKKAEGVIDDNVIVIENESDGNSESTVSAARMNPENVEVGNENPEQLDIEKTAAMPGKQTRLPIVSTEA